MYQDKASRRNGRPRSELSSSRSAAPAHQVPAALAPAATSGVSRDVA
jgi:hypothetical protein